MKKLKFLWWLLLVPFIVNCSNKESVVDEKTVTNSTVKKDFTEFARPSES